MKLKIILLCLTTTLCFAQNNGSGFGTTSPNPSAAVDITSTNQGLLLPRMTTAQRDAIPAPAKGLNIYNLDIHCIEFFNGTSWHNICWGGITPRPAVFTQIDCNKKTTGILTVGEPASKVTQTISITTDIPGTYDIATNVVNGISFSGSGTLVAGTQDIVLIATGTPTTATTSTYSLNTTPSCNFTRTIEPYIDTVVAPNGKTWMAYNLGGTGHATYQTDYTQYGSFYQWGRGNDGHQLITRTGAGTWDSTPTNATSTSTQSTKDTPEHGIFIINNSNWLSTNNNNLWQGIDGVNNPCPKGFRVPTLAELQEVFTSFAINNTTDAYTKMKIVGSAYRINNTLTNNLSSISYWSSTPKDNWNSFSVMIGPSNIIFGTTSKSCGKNVRCIKD